MVTLIVLILSLWFIYSAYMHSIEIKNFIYKVLNFNDEMLGDRPSFSELRGILK